MASLMLLAFLAPCVLAAILTFLMRGASRRIGFVDRPGGHKQHAAPVALGGGMAIFISACAPLVIATAAARVWHFSAPHWLPDILRPHVAGIATRLPEVLAIVGGALVLHVMGLLDDVHPLPSGPRLIVQAVVAFFLVWGFELRALRFLDSYMPIPVSIPLTVLWIVVITNAFNFLDNMDGLCAGVAALAGAIFALTAMSANQIFVPAMAWILVGALVGFLLFNFAPASIFMGDAGSMVIGYLLAVLTVLTTFYDPRQQTRPFGVLVPLVVLAVPLYDAITVVFHRLRARQSIFRGDRRHFSHRLVQRGLSTRAAVLTIYLATGATSLGAVLLPHAEWPGACVIFGQCLCVVAIIAILEHAKAKSQP
ncbi:MAG TPA: MraY family glycosyltransferase [Phycisphaerae bacterium]